MDEKGITSHVKASKALLALNAALNAARINARTCAWNTARIDASSTAWVAAWNAARVASLNDARVASLNDARVASLNDAWNDARVAALNATRNADLNGVENADRIAAKNGEAPEVIGRLCYRMAERTTLIYMYVNLTDTLNAAYDAQNRPWKPSKVELVSLLNRLNSKNNATQQLLTPFSHVLLGRIDQLPNRKIFGIW